MGGTRNAVLSLATAAHLSASVSSSSGTTTVRLEGAAEADGVRLLEELFARVHRDAQGTGTDAVLLDVRRLAMICSPALHPLLRWIEELKNLDPNRRYGVRILSDPSILWQRGTLLTLQKIAPDCVVVDSSSPTEA